MATVKLNEDFHLKHGLPEKKYLAALLRRTIRVLNNENSVLRPFDTLGVPGGLLSIRDFAPDIPVVLVPDLHARTVFFEEILSFPLPLCEFCLSDKQGGENTAVTIAQALDQKRIFLVCLGDGFHTEAAENGAGTEKKSDFDPVEQARRRWLEAGAAYSSGCIKSEAMINEMKKSLTLMQMVMECKCKWPDYFHFIKGNHENILNERGGGNLPFGKYTCEGTLVRSFMESVYGFALLRSYAEFESRLPLFVCGSCFLASHAQPALFFEKNELINGLRDEAVVLGLTWTDNGEADERSVAAMLASFLPDKPSALYFGGHRCISGKYRLLADGKYVQLHNPFKHYICILNPRSSFNPNTDIYDTSKRTGA